MRVHELGKHEQPEVFVVLDFRVAEFDEHFGCLLDDRAGKHWFDTWFQFFLYVFDDQDTAACKTRAQFVFELFVVES